MIAERLDEIRSRVATAALRYGRQPGSVTLLAVSKQQPAEAIRELVRAGQNEFGESYLQEALPKIDALRDLDLQWHYIGQIQSNKTRSIAEQFAWVHTVDRLKIADRLNEQRPIGARPLNVCLQVKLADEAGKGGVAPNEVPALANQIASLPRLRLRGLMCIPPPRDKFEEQLSYFKQTAQLFDELKRGGCDVDTLSMGMSGDLEAAIATGATIVRVGTAIFGERQKT
jgi:PLP dependent protein